MGHISPLIGIILSLKNKYKFIYFGLKDSMEEEVCRKYNIDFYRMDLKPFYRKNIFKNIKTFYLILKEKKNINKKFKKYNLKAIISSGGFVSIPLVLGLKSKNKILLESNSSLGLANKFLSFFVKYIGVQFDSINHKKAVLIGNPIFIEKPVFDHQYFYYDEPLILFVGGSNGAYEIVQLASEFNNKYPNIKIFVITGDRYFETFKFGENAVVLKKIYKLSSVLNKFKLVISRAGASTITELLQSNIDFILFPSKNVSGNHQYKNAKYLYDKKICGLIDEINADTIDNIYNNFNANNIRSNNSTITNIGIDKSIELIEKLIDL